MSKTMEDNCLFLLNTLNPIVTTYIDKPSSAAKYPYAVIKFNALNEVNENFDEFFFDIHVWYQNKTNNDNGFYKIESMTDSIRNRLKYLRENGYIINLISYLKVEDENDTIHHRVIKYHAKYINMKDGGYNLL